MNEPRFQVGARVVARRDRRLQLDILDYAEPGKLHEQPMYQCEPAEEHAGLHGRNRSVRWFREDDLDAA